MRGAALLAWMTVLSLALPEAAATELRGRVIVRGELAPPSEPATRRYYWSLDNGVLLCRPHHNVIHHTPWSVRIDERGLPVFTPPRGHRGRVAPPQVGNHELRRRMQGLIAPCEPGDPGAPGSGADPPRDP